jgi:hypothetical protein
VARHLGASLSSNPAATLDRRWDPAASGHTVALAGGSGTAAAAAGVGAGGSTDSSSDSSNASSSSELYRAAASRIWCQCSRRSSKSPCKTENWCTRSRGENDTLSRPSPTVCVGVFGEVTTFRPSGLSRSARRAPFWRGICSLRVTPAGRLVFTFG